MAIDREKVLAAAQKYVEKKKYDKAVLEYERIVQEDPNDARTLLKMGDLQLKMEGYAAAVATYERVVCAARAFLKREGPITSLDALADVPCIVLGNAPTRWHFKTNEGPRSWALPR